MDDEVLANLPLPQHLLTSADANEDGFLSNIEFYDAIDPLSGDGQTYIFDNFEWAHCEKSDFLGENPFSTEATSSDAYDDETQYVFSGGVNPTLWDGDSYEDLPPDKVGFSYG